MIMWPPSAAAMPAGVGWLARSDNSPPGSAEGRRCDGLALAAVHTRPDGVVHALKRDQATAGVADRGTDADVEFPGLRHCAFRDAAGFFQRETHGCLLLRHYR
jgi:hypothetical protein